MIEVTGIGFSYGSACILRDLSCRMEAGKVYGIVGPNGSGKTTLIRLMLGFLQPESGSIRFDGREVRSYGRREFARQVSAVPQEMSTDFPFTVRELVLLGRMPHLGPLGLEGQADLRVAEEIMERCGLLGLADRPIHTLSGGEQRRASLARALAQQAQILLLDEPTSGLDLAHQIAILHQLRREAGENKTVVVVVHDLNLALAYCDRLLLLHEGGVAAEGLPLEVLTESRVAEIYGVRVKLIQDGSGPPFIVSHGLTS